MRFTSEVYLTQCCSTFVELNLSIQDAGLGIKHFAKFSLIYSSLNTASLILNIFNN